MKKILIVGVDSFIGNSLFNYLIKKKIATTGTTRRKETLDQNRIYFDLEKPDFDILKNKFSTVIICASITNILECTNKQVESKNINVKNTIKLIKALSEEKIFIIYLSSNAVFDGKKKYYKVSDKTCPLNIYGKMKVE